MTRFCVNLTDVDDFEGSTRHYKVGKIQNATDTILYRSIHKFGLSCYSSSLTHLTIDDVELTDAKLLHRFIKNFPALQTLRFEGIYLKNPTTSSIESLIMPNLKSLSFIYNSNDLLHLFNDVHDTLQVLKICLIPFETEQVKMKNYYLVHEILQNNRTTLHKLNTYDVNFDEDFLQLISKIHFQRLTQCSLSFISYLPVESLGFKNFIKQNSSTLEKFKIRTFNHLNQQHLKILVEDGVNIKNLNLIICSNCVYDQFTGFRSLDKLEKLKICPSNEGGSTFENFIKTKILCHRHKKMKHLNLGMINVTGEIINKIIFSFPNLESLRLSSSSDIESGLVKLLTDKLSKLQRLVIS